MREPWRPYPNEPRVRNLTDRLNELREQTLAAILAGNDSAARGLLLERDAIRMELDELTAALLRDAAASPRWIEPTEADVEAGAVPCLECGNRIPAGESSCSYCGWTYRADVQNSAGTNPSPDPPGQ